MYLECPCEKFFACYLDEILLEKLRNHWKECSHSMENHIPPNGTGLAFC